MRRHYRRVVRAIIVILLVLVLAWWIAGELYQPYPPQATPTPGYWPTRITATIVPSATPTRVIHTPIQPTIGYTETPMQPPVTITPIPTFTSTLISTPISAPTYTPTPQITETPTVILYNIVKDKEYDCITYFIRPWGIKAIYRCWQPAWWRLPFEPPSIFIP